MRPNFLPWRRERQRHCCRVWGMLFLGSFLLSLTMMSSLRASCVVLSRGAEMRLNSEEAILKGAETRYAQWRELNTQFQQRQQTLISRAKTQPWQPVLASLSAAIPAQSWLTQLHYQTPTLTLTGYATTLSALTMLSEALKTLPGFTPGPAGEMQQDNQGRWMFTFTLQRQE